MHASSDNILIWILKYLRCVQCYFGVKRVILFRLKDNIYIYKALQKRVTTSKMCNKTQLVILSWVFCTDLLVVKLSFKGVVLEMKTSYMTCRSHTVQNYCNRNCITKKVILERNSTFNRWKKVTKIYIKTKIHIEVKVLAHFFYYGKKSIISILDTWHVRVNEK